MRFFLKSIDVWKIVETGWIKPEETDESTITQTSAWFFNDKALHALCQALYHLNSQEFHQTFNRERERDELVK